MSSDMLTKTASAVRTLPRRTNTTKHMKRIRREATKKMEMLRPFRKQALRICEISDLEGKKGEFDKVVS